MRLDEDLVREAGHMARLQKRSVPRQIEYWAEIGKAVEKVLPPHTLMAIRQGLANIYVEMAPSTPVNSDDVWQEVEDSRQGNTLSTRVSEAPVNYQASPSAPGYLEQIQPDGTKIKGRFVDGRFVPAGK